MDAQIETKAGLDLDLISKEQIFDPKSGLLLHEIIHLNAGSSQPDVLNRVDFSREDEFLQAAVIDIPSGHSFRPHIHLEREQVSSNFRAQESWVVVSGHVLVHYYSEDRTYLCTKTLGAGDLTITYRGGHGYEAGPSGAIVYEFKTGPYLGREIDKDFLD